jgi:hypothetical protein
MANPNERAVINVPSWEDLIDRIARFESVTIAGRVYSADLLIPQLTISAKDLLSEAAACPAMVLYWGLAAAQARRHKAAVDAAYRTWRDRKYLDAKRAVEGAKVMSDAQAEATYRTDPEYGEWRKRIDASQEAAENAEAIHEAFKLKGEMVKVQERLLRDEAGGPYYVAENQRLSVPRQPQVA